MPHFVKVTDQNLVREFWDSLPPVPVGTDGWRNAVVDIPTIDNNKEYYGEFTYDLQQDPVVVSRQIIPLTLQERKDILINKNNSDFNQIIETAYKVPNLFDSQELQNYKQLAANNKAMIQNCETLQQLDELVLNDIDLF